MPARNTTLALGLFSVPGKLMKATESPDAPVNLCVGQPSKAVHEALPITRPAHCSTCGEIEDYEALKKGVKQGDVYALLDRDDIADAKAEFTKEFKSVMNFVAHPAADFFAMTAPSDTVNYVLPATSVECKPACKGCGICRYALLVRLVAENPDVAFVTLYTPVSVTSLYVLQARGEVLVLEKRTRTQELKAAPAIPQPAEFKDKLYAQLEAFLEVEPYNPEDYEDRYAAHLQKLASEAELVAEVVTGVAPPKATKFENDEDLLAKLSALAKAS